MTGVITRLRREPAVLAVVSLLLALLPILHMFYLVSTTGADNPSDDYILYSSLVSRILGGHYNWTHYFADTFIGGTHSLAFLFLVRLLIIKATHWNMYAELDVSFATALARLGFLLASAWPFLAPRLRPLTLPILAALVFSNSQVNVFTYGEVGLQGFTQLALAAGLYALLRFPRAPLSAPLTSLGGVVAAWSGAPGLAIWPAFFLCAYLLAPRGRRTFLVLSAGLLIALLPYLWYGLLFPSSWSPLYTFLGLPPPGQFTTIRPLNLISALGLPFAPVFDPTVARMTGLIAVTLWLVLLAAARRVRLSPPSLALPLSLLTASLSADILITGARGSLTPWYPLHYMNVWIGLLLLAGILLSHSPRYGIPARLIAAGPVLVTALLFAATNGTYAEDVFFLYSRAPASASCFRHEDIAPPFCEREISQWPPGLPGYATILQAPDRTFGLSAFGPVQEWSLQGDFILPTVTVLHADSPRLSWSPGTPGVLAWQDYIHRDLLLSGQNRLTWRLTLPANVRHAHFATSVSILAGRPSVTLSIREQGRILDRIHITTAREVGVSIPPHPGHDVIILFETDGNDGDTARFSYPVVTLHVNTAVPPGHDHSPPLPPPAPVALRLPALFRSSWHATGANVRAAAHGAYLSTRALGGGASLHFRSPPCLAGLADFDLTASVPGHVYPRALAVIFHLAHPNASATIWIPLRPDAATYTYTVPIRLLLPSHLSTLTELQIVPTRDNIRPEPVAYHVEALLFRGHLACVSVPSSAGS